MAIPSRTSWMGPLRAVCIALAVGVAWAGCTHAPPPEIPPTPIADVPSPIRLFSHADPATEFFVFDYPGAREFVASLPPVLDAVNRDRRSGEPAVGLTVVRWAHDRGSVLVSPEWTPVRHIEVGNRSDIWLQDFVEFALVPSLPGGAADRPALIDPNRGFGLDPLAARLARDRGAKWIRIPSPRRGEASGGGNLEALPNDLLLMGSNVGKALAEFVLGRGYGDRHVLVDTSWLAIGHVDEVLSHVVLPGTPCGFALVRASPRRGLALASTAPASSERIPLGSAEFVGHQETIARILDGAVEEVRRAAAIRTPACSALPVIPVPALFRCKSAAATPSACRAQLPNVVNMAVLGRHLLVPDPGHPRFRTATREALEAAGQRVYFLEAGAHHGRGGGVHCATNVWRRARGTVASRAAVSGPEAPARRSPPATPPGR